jgi:hypothetical protein
MSDDSSALPPQLTPAEARILGSLVEKAATTPEAYPLTVNAVVLACNQKTSREPVMDLQPGAVEHALRGLEDRRMVRVTHGARANRYEHRFAEAYGITSAQAALLAVLLLRGAQTGAELHARTERLASFADAAAVRDALERLATRTPALVVNVGRGAGQREDRYMHLLSGPVDAQAILASGAAASATASAARTDLLARVEALEAEMAELRAEIAALRDSAAR